METVVSDHKPTMMAIAKRVEVVSLSTINLLNSIWSYMDHLWWLYGYNPKYLVSQCDKYNHISHQNIWLANATSITTYLTKDFIFHISD